MNVRFRSRFLGILALTTMGGLAPISAIAQDTGSDWITLSPRIWLTQTQLPDSPSFFREAYFVPSYGASLSIAPPMLEGVSILLMGLYGAGNGDASYDADAFQPGIDLDVDLVRIDVEGLLIYQIPGVPVNVFVGARYVLLEERMDGSNTMTSVALDVDNEITIVKAGIGASGGLSENGKHRLFGNVSAGVGFARTKTRFQLASPGFAGLDIRGSFRTESPTIDINVGYQYSFSDSIGLRLRYRVTMAFIDDFLGQETTNVTHGPELSLAKSW